MKLAIGAVQFGLDYGVTNPAGKTPINEVERILNIAKENNINTIDTSPAYGNSEEVLGKVLNNDWQIITKTTPLKDDIFPITEDFHQSLSRLKREHIYGVLIHNFDDIYNENFKSLYAYFQEVKHYNTIKKFGFSAYTPEQVNFLLENFDFDIIQVPINIFDQRLVQGGQLKKLKEKGVEIHARSVFLQGLLLGEVPRHNYFQPWKKHFDWYFSDLKYNNISKLSAALNFAINITELDKIIVGVNNVVQLTEILSSIKNNTHFNCDAFALKDENLINPALWKL